MYDGRFGIITYERKGLSKMLVNKKSTDGTGKDVLLKAGKQEVNASIAKAGKKYEKMLSLLSK